MMLVRDIGYCRRTTDHDSCISSPIAVDKTYAWLRCVAVARRGGRLAGAAATSRGLLVKKESSFTSEATCDLKSGCSKSTNFNFSFGSGRRLLGFTKNVEIGVKKEASIEAKKGASAKDFTFSSSFTFDKGGR